MSVLRIWRWYHYVGSGLVWAWVALVILGQLYSGAVFIGLWP